MAQNILSPEQKRTIQVFQYNKLKDVQDTNLSEAKQKLEPVFNSMKKQNDTLHKNVNTLQKLLDTTKPESMDKNEMLLEEIRWNTYFYKKYNNQTQIMGTLIGVCILLNVLRQLTAGAAFIGGAGFVLSVSFIYILYLLWDLMVRDNQNFDEYTFQKYQGEYVRGGPQFAMDASANCAMNKIADFYA